MAAPQSARIETAPQMAQPHVQHQTSTHMMKTTRSGRPFVKDIHDLFSTLIVSLPMDNHRHLFRNYASTFTTEEAIANLGSLKFTQSNRYPDPKDPSRIVTTTTTTTFSMTKDMAKSVCQTFMDAKLFENATDSSSKTFKDKNLYTLTPKGTYILEHFVARNGITSHNLAQLFSNQLNPIRLYVLERSIDNDSLILTRPVIETIFRRFAGQQPNDITHRSQEKEHDVTSDSASASSNEKSDRNLGVEVKDRIQNQKRYRHTFYGLGILDWLCDFTTAIAREEALKIANEFLKNQLIEVIPDKRSEKMDSEHQRVSRSLLYQASELGQRIAGWDLDYATQTTAGEKLNGEQSKNGLRGMLSYANIKSSENGRLKNGQTVTERSSSLEGEHVANNVSQRQHRAQISSNDKLRVDHPADGIYPLRQESSAKKLSQILEDATLRSLFMDFLKANFCEENLLFLLDVTEFKAKYSAAGSLSQVSEPLVADAFRIYNNYLAPGSQHELNIDHALRQHLIQYMSSLISNEEGGSVPAHQITVRLYDKIEDTIFRLMATDSVPKFVKTEKYSSAVNERRSTDGGVTARDAALVAQQVGKQHRQHQSQHNIEPTHIPSEPNHNHQNGSNGDTASIGSNNNSNSSNGDVSSIRSSNSAKSLNGGIDVIKKPSVATIVTPSLGTNNNPNGNNGDVSSIGSRNSAKSLNGGIDVIKKPSVATIVTPSIGSNDNSIGNNGDVSSIGSRNSAKSLSDGIDVIKRPSVATIVTPSIGSNDNPIGSNGDVSSIGSRNSAKSLSGGIDVIKKPSVATIVTPPIGSNNNPNDSNGDVSSIGSRNSAKSLSGGVDLIKRPSIATIVTPAGNGIVSTSEVINGEAL